MIPRRALLLALASLSMGASAQVPLPSTLPPEVLAIWKVPSLRGQGQMRFWGVHLYDARLWVGPSFSSSGLEQQVFALELRYGRSFEGRSLAERALKEMKALATVSAQQAERWVSFMLKAFPDVRPGDRLTGVHSAEGAVHFYFNGQSTGELIDPNFSRHFFDIWFSPRTSDPALRSALLALTASVP